MGQQLSLLNPPVYVAFYLTGLAQVADRVFPSRDAIGWSERIRTSDDGTKARCLTAWLRSTMAEVTGLEPVTIHLTGERSTN